MSTETSPIDSPWKRFSYAEVDYELDEDDLFDVEPEDPFACVHETELEDVEEDELAWGAGA